MTNVKHYFGEQESEFVGGQSLPVWQSPKFILSRAKACELIDSQKYGLVDSDFWILKNKTKSGKMGYTGLIISHNGCLKINEVLRSDGNAYDPSCISEIKQSPYTGGIYMTYCDNEVFEVAEATKDTVKNSYPLAILVKRLVDRVILKKSKIAFDGIYSEDESDDFKPDEGSYNIDSETGEVISSGKPENTVLTAQRVVKPVKQVVHPIPNAGKKYNPVTQSERQVENAADQVKVSSIPSPDKMTLDEALEFVTTSSNPKFKGIRFGEVLNTDDKEAALKWLTIVATRAKSDEKIAAGTVLNAIKAGEIYFNSDRIDSSEDLPF